MVPTVGGIPRVFLSSTRIDWAAGGVRARQYYDTVSTRLIDECLFHANMKSYAKIYT